MEAETPPKVPAKTVNAAFLTIVATYVIFCGFFGVLAGLDNADRFPGVTNPLVIAGRGFLDGLTSFTYMTLVRGHGFSFLLITLVVATILVKSSATSTLVGKLVTSAIGGALAAGAFQMTFMVMEEMGMPKFAITFANLVCGALAGALGGLVFWLLMRSPKTPKGAEPPETPAI